LICAAPKTNTCIVSKAAPSIIRSGYLLSDFLLPPPLVLYGVLGEGEGGYIGYKL
jgi:hypothetical protein